MLLPAKVATLVYAVAAGFVFPVCIPILAALIYVTRLYFKRLFNIEYPSLHG